MSTLKSRNLSRKIRHLRLRKNLFGTPQKPRLAVFRSLKNIYVQIIDDENSITLCSASTLEKSLNLKGVCNIEAAKTIGKTAAQRALSKGIKNIVFDRGGHAYHGKIAALADAAREEGLVF